MDLVQAAVLGVVQGATEYLPVSSSGHLVLVPALLGWKTAPFSFNILVQMGTLLGVIIYYFSDLKKMATAMVRGLLAAKPFEDSESRTGWLVGLATVPAAIIGLVFKDLFEEVFANPLWSAVFLFLTALLLAAAEFFGKRVRDQSQHTLLDAVVIGLFQALALFPGVSRSGSTIAAGMFLGLDRSAAARFSFLMSIPVMVGAGVLALSDLLENPSALSEHGAGIAVGFLVSAITGYLVIRWFLAFVKNRSLYGFSIYCFVAACTMLVFLNGKAS